MCKYSILIYKVIIMPKKGYYRTNDELKEFIKSNIEIRPKPAGDLYSDLIGDCHYWTRAKDKSGYGHITHKGKMHVTHRFVWTLYHGPLSEDLVVRHKCDNRSCCNLEHLTIGTHRDNVRDSIERKRHHFGFPDLRGVNSSGAKLNDKQVIEIRKKYSTGSYTFKSLSEQYPVSAQMISDIVKRKNWTHL